MATDLQIIDRELRQLRADPATHFWTKSIIGSILTKDPADVAEILTKLSNLANDRCNAIYEIENK